MRVITKGNLLVHCSWVYKSFLWLMCIHKSIVFVLMRQVEVPINTFGTVELYIVGCENARTVCWRSVARLH